MKVDLRKAGWRQLNNLTSSDDEDGSIDVDEYKASTKLGWLMRDAEAAATRARNANCEHDRLWWAGRADGLRTAVELLRDQLQRARRARGGE